MFKFECEICAKEVKRGKKFSFDMFEIDSDSTGTGYICEDEICLSCAKKIENKINSMRKAGRKRKGGES
tara:strand:- start:119 stop:325 length:207 start_codon:yes stop_codon:yes gene_type:complete